MVPLQTLTERGSISFEVPAEYFLFESADAVTPLNLKEKSLYEKIRLVQELGDHEKDIILGVIESFLMNKRIMSLINKEVVGA